jgi:hypothetical protein
VEAMIATVKVERTATIAGNWNHGIDGNFHSSVLLRDSANITGNHASGVSLSGDSGLLTFDGLLRGPGVERAVHGALSAQCLVH